MSLPLIAVREVYFLSVLQLFGVLNFDLWFGGARSRRIVAALVVIALLGSLAWLVLVATDTTGQPPSLTATTMILTDTRFGELWLARAVLLFLIAISPWRAGSAVLAGLALSLTAAAGHAGAEDNPLQFGGDVIHLLAAGAWLGGLIPFALAMRRDDGDVVARRFSTLGTVCVGLIVVTGAMNSWYLVGGPRNLIDTDYGRVLLAKLALFAVLLAAAAVNRFRLTPRGDAGALRRNALIETALGIFIVTIVAVLGTMAPGYHGAG
ncbi:MAG TPA: CopD family protein [Stellaceae bacterium]|jgi:putative copper resistance protein D